jgi:hypothetical protein
MLVEKKLCILLMIMAQDLDKQKKIKTLILWMIFDE